ncbi:MAG TPA: DmsE family decaheme c-type cytochrome [Syntrophorhabdales bacterium]|nr:DmsE family decaheme c-type cytochrome [Syntrophorhabdales bacterium]
MKKFCVFSGFVVFLLLSLLLMAPAGVLAQAKGGGATYVGSDTCKNCHEDQFKSYERSVHGRKVVPGSPAKQEGCESCHGPGSVHVNNGGGKGTMIAFTKGENSDMKSGVCLNCHANSSQVALWDSGVHKKKDVACSDCHSMHSGPKAAMGYGTGLSPLGYLPGPEYVTCGKCHLDVKAQINRRSHHPIIEGRITCSNCHQPHGSMGPAQIKADTVNQLCYKCHADKRGPYMNEHPPVEENCAYCHQPHGGVHVMLLTEKVPNLCQGCHDATRHPGTRYSNETLFSGGRIGGTASNKAFGRSCLNCHNNIHGSNAIQSPGGDFFVR